MWVKSTDIGDKSEMSPKSVSFTLSSNTVNKIISCNFEIIPEIPEVQSYWALKKAVHLEIHSESFLNFLSLYK